MVDTIRPLELGDVVANLVQGQDDAGDPDNTALYDSTFIQELITVADAWTFSTHSGTYLYDAAASRAGLATAS